MPSDSTIVQPPAGASAPIEVQPATGAAPETPTTGAGSLPDSILKLGAFQAIMAGNPAAFTLDFATAAKSPDVKLIGDNKSALMSAGISFYANKAGGKGTVFNSLKIQPAAIKAADDAGQLASIAPDFQALNASVAASGADNPVLQGGQDVSAMPALPAPPQMASGAMPAPAPASLQTKLAGVRAKASLPSSPTSGSRPGAGRLLNAILRPAV